MGADRSHRRIAVIDGSFEDRQSAALRHLFQEQRSRLGTELVEIDGDQCGIALDLGPDSGDRGWQLHLDLPWASPTRTSSLARSQGTDRSRSSAAMIATPRG